MLIISESNTIAIRADDKVWLYQKSKVKQKYFLKCGGKNDPAVSGKKCACGNISAKLYCIASCTFRNTFEGKCPVSGAKSMFRFIWNGCESGSILLRCLLYVSQQFEN